MPLPKRSRDEDGRFREKRSDTKVETLKQEYSIFNGINGSTKLGTLKKTFRQQSLDGVIRQLRRNK